MGLFSFLRKNKQDSAPDQGEYRSRSAEQSSVLRSRTGRSANTTGRAASGRGKAGKDAAAADPLLPEKKRARRRLIGAVALALAVIIVLPMILDSEPKPLNEDIAIQIPSKDQPAAATEVAKTDPAASAVAQPAPVADNGKLASASSSLDQKEETIEPATVAPPAAPVASVMPPVASVAPAKPAEKPAVKPEEKKPVERKEEPKHKEEPKKDVKKDVPKKEVKETTKPKADTHDDSARALAILEGKSTSSAAQDKKPAAAGGKFVIQVAALATQEKVNELRNKLSGAGIHSFTQKIATQGGDRTRIRVGPFGSRDEAEKMGARIKKLGLNATIVPA